MEKCISDGGLCGLGGMCEECPYKRTAMQCQARGCSGCSICDPKELNEERTCHDCGEQFTPPPIESMKDMRICEPCAQYA